MQAGYWIQVTLWILYIHGMMMLIHIDFDINDGFRQFPYFICVYGNSYRQFMGVCCFFYTPTKQAWGVSCAEKIFSTQFTLPNAVELVFLCRKKMFHDVIFLQIFTACRYVAFHGKTRAIKLKLCGWWRHKNCHLKIWFWQYPGKGAILLLFKVYVW